jgi:ATP-dependent Clp protease ATP-binding subunit ClpA
MSEFSSQEPLITSIIESSFKLALMLNQTTITTEHLLAVIISAKNVKNFLNDNSINAKSLYDELIRFIGSQTQYLQNKIQNADPNYMTGQFTEVVGNIIFSACASAKKQNKEVAVSDILLSILNTEDSYASYFMHKYGLTEDILVKIDSEVKNLTDSGISEYCINLNEQVKTNKPILIGREKELFAISHTLVKQKKSNVIIVGDPGVGKSAIVEGLAQLINKNKVPKILKNKIIYSLNIGSVLAGCRYRGDFEEKIKTIIHDLTTNKNAILFIDEAHQLTAGENGQSGIGFASMLKPELSRGNIKVIAATTWEGYRQTFEKDTALMRRFRLLPINEPSLKETELIIKGLKNNLEKFHTCKITSAAITTAVELSDKYQKDKRLPDKAIDLIDSACARQVVLNSHKKVIDYKDIIAELTDFIGIPITDYEKVNEDNILDITDNLKKTIFHQENAINKVAESIIISRAGLKSSLGPIGSFIFTGPSGSGKSYLAKQLADYLHMNLLKYDMSEFQEKHSIARLIGAPPGYVGFNDNNTGEGQLVNDIIKYPNSVILIDEVEKAHPDIFSIFLQILDEGRITSTTGKVADCKNLIVIMTSNLGETVKNKTQLGFNDKKTGKSAPLAAIDSFFLTELRGRITGIIEFNELDDVTLRRITCNCIQSIGNINLHRKINLTASESLITYILSLNTKKQYGARNIANLVNSIIKYPLSVEILKGNILNNSNVYLDWKNNNLQIKHSMQTNIVKVPVDVLNEKMEK